MSIFYRLPMYYKLAADGRTPVPATFEEVSLLLSDIAARRVAATHLGRAGWVSTVFLVLDHGLINEAPVLFETMVFGGLFDGYLRRAVCWDEALRNHQWVVREVLCHARPMTKKIFALAQAHRSN